MKSQRVYVGLDYHQSSVQVCVEDAAGRVLLNRACPNDTCAIVTMVEACGTVAGAAIEACCGAADLAEQLINQAGWSVDLAHAGYVARMKQSPDKTDFADAHLLADLERVGYLPKVWLASQPIRELRRLVRHRDSQVRQRRSAKQRVGAILRDCRVFPPAAVRRWTKAWVAWLRGVEDIDENTRWIIDEQLAELAHLGERIKNTERRLRLAAGDDTVCARLIELPGIGEVTAWVIRAEIGRFDRFRNGKQLARFCGLSPRNASSGTRQADAGLIKAGSPMLRSILVEAAHRLINRTDRWGMLARKLRLAGKKHSVVVAAVANRWVRSLYHEMSSMPTAA